MCVCVCVCVHAHCLPACVCMLVCACVPVYVIFPSILIHVLTDIINTATGTRYLYVTVTHILMANVSHACVIDKHQSYIFFGKHQFVLSASNNVQCIGKITQTQQSTLYVTSEAAIYLHVCTIHRLCSHPPSRITYQQSDNKGTQR